MHTRLESGSLRNMKEAYHQGRRHMLLFHAFLAVSALLRDTATQQNTQNNFPRARKKSRGMGVGRLRLILPPPSDTTLPIEHRLRS